MPTTSALCLTASTDGPCFRRADHAGRHAARPTVWNSISDDPGDKTRKKIVKAGFATPRGGAKGGYQNHVSRSSRVIIPLEHAGKVNFGNYEEGAAVRLTAAQASQALASGTLSEGDERLWVKIDDTDRQCFVLYRSQQDHEHFPIPNHWWPCEHRVNGAVTVRRSARGEDFGHYLIRIPRQQPLGPPQGIFAPEYTNRTMNYACQVFLTHLAYRTEGHLQDANAVVVAEILHQLNYFDMSHWKLNGVIDGNGTTCCPLCGRRIGAEELHEVIDPSRVPGLENSGVQLAETRSTLVNLYHLQPLLYAMDLGHTPVNIAWGHAHCNTLLSQRASYSLNQLREGAPVSDTELYWDDSETFVRSSDNRAWVSVTPVPPGSETFSAFLAAQGLQEVIDSEDEDDD